MKLSEYLRQDLISVGLSCNTQQETLDELTHLLVEGGVIDDEATFKSELAARERMGTSGWGHGVACPHVKTGLVKQLSLAIGISIRGIEWNSLDDQPASIIFLVVIPQDQPGTWLKVMQQIAEMMYDSTFRRFLTQCATVDEVFALFEEWDRICEERRR